MICLMRRSWIKINLIVFVALLASCGDSSAPQEEKANITPGDSTITRTQQPEEGKITGELISLDDLDGDNRADTIIVTPPEIINDMDCADSTCTTYFRFTNSKFPAFSQQQALGGVIGNAGDLDRDGICEIYFVGDWFTSSWAGMNIYSLKNNTWKKIANASVRRQDMGEDEALYLPYEKRIKRFKEYFEILENVMDEDGNETLVPKKFELY